MSTDSYTRITATRIFNTLEMKVSFDLIDKLINRSRGFCHIIIKSLSVFTSLKHQADHINQILDLNQEAIVDIIFKYQVSAKTTPISPEREKELTILREYSEKIAAAIENSLEKVDLIEKKYLNESGHAMKEWQKKQIQNAALITDGFIQAGHIINEQFTLALAEKLFFEICNEKTFSPDKQIAFSLQQLPDTPISHNEAITQVLFENDQTKQALLASFIHLTEKMNNESLIIADLYQKVRALCAATKDFILEENPDSLHYKELAVRLLDIASDPVEM